MIEVKDLDQNAEAGQQPAGSVVPSNQLSKNPLAEVHYGRALSLVITLLFACALLACLNGMLVPHLRTIFELGATRVFPAQFAIIAGYISFAYVAGKSLSKIGYQRTIIGGLLTIAAGAFLFLAAAAFPYYAIFLFATLALAGGLATVQVVVYPYAALLGDPKTSASRLTLAYIFVFLAKAIAPIVGGVLVLTAAPATSSELRSLSVEALQYYRLAQAESVKFPYILMGIAIVALAVVAASLHLPDVTTNTRVATESIWTHGRLIAGAIGIFLCVGAEVSITGSLAAYLSLPDVGHLSTKTAVQLVPLFWVGCIIGAFLGAALMRRFGAGTLLAIFALGAITSLAISIITSGPVAVWSIVACGLFSSIIFPSVFVIGLRKLKEAIGQGSGLMVAATIGGLVVPTVQSVLADRVGLHRAMILPLACYAYIFFFGLSSARSKERLAAE